MSYLPRNSRAKGKKFKWALVLVAGLFVVFFAFKTIFPSVLTSSVHFVASPFWRAESLVSEKFSYTWGFIQSRRNMVEENKRLREEMEESRIQLLHYDFLRGENEEIKKLLNRETERETVLSAVLGKPPKLLYDTIIVDVGFNKGVEEDDLVMAGENVAIGRVSEALKNTSKVRLFSSPGEETEALITRNNLSVTAIGRGGGDFEIQLPQEIDVTHDDLIVLPGIEGMILARVVEVEHLPADSFQRVWARSPINISELNRVIIEI